MQSVVIEAPGSYRVVDLMPAFWQFWSRAERRPVDEQAMLFQQMLVARYPDVYTAPVIGLKADVPLAEGFEGRYGQWLPMLSPHIAAMRRVSDRIATDLPRYERSFREAFPDMDYRGEVYFLNSLGGFDGATRTVKGATALLFGVDMIAYVYGADADPQAFFHHELFHIYHSQFLTADDATPLYLSLWQEGLAEHVAKSLNPSASGVMLFGLPTDMPERARPMVPQLARELRAQMDSTSRDIYARFFLGGAGSGTMPPRSGYYVGYLVAERVGRNRTLKELSTMRGPSLRSLVDDVLRDLEAGR
jgi:hypothetical protein